jgi:predicted transcriptional regulator
MFMQGSWMRLAIRAGDRPLPKSSKFAGLVRLLYQQRFPEAQGLWVEGFLRLMVELRRVFGNDLDKVIILSAIGQQLLLDARLPARTYDQWIDTPLVEGRERVTNIDALARATGIPRESVRRKVNELIADGLVVRNEGHRLMIASGAAARLADSTEITIEMLDTLLSSYLAMMVRLKALEVSMP